MSQKRMIIPIDVVVLVVEVVVVVVSDVVVVVLGANLVDVIPNRWIRSILIMRFHVSIAETRNVVRWTWSLAHGCSLSCFTPH